MKSLGRKIEDFPDVGSPEGREETRINSGSNVRDKITHLLINGTYTLNKREMEDAFCNYHLYLL